MVEAWQGLHAGTVMKALRDGRPVLFAGIDVHKKANVVACRVYVPGEGSHDCYDVDPIRLVAKPETMVTYIKKVIGDNGLEDPLVWCAYEAGPTGTFLQRHLTLSGFRCDILPLGYVKRSDAKPRQKEDRKDARVILECLAAGHYIPVHVPEQAVEDTRDFLRMRAATVEDAAKLKQMINSLALRHNIHYDTAGSGKKGRKPSKWTQRHIKFLWEAEMEPMARETMNEYLLQLEQRIECIKRYDERVDELCASEPFREQVQRLVCIKGIQNLTALTIILEVGDFGRFSKAGEFASYVGLVPSESSSGERRRSGGLTKTGNPRVRRMLILAAKAIAKGSETAKKKQFRAKAEEECGAEMAAYASRANTRLRKRTTRLRKRGKHANVVTAAVARELACFVWGALTGHIA